ncbi:hypothetical protein NTE19_003364 [Vibrio fluvialis]|nr:hypothetical protein [Vibrio fluvialis]
MRSPFDSKLKEWAHKGVHTAFRMDNLFRLDIDGMPDDMPLFVKNVSYSKGTIISDEKDIGTGVYNSPSKKSAGSVTVTCFDDEKGKVSDFISSLQDKIFNEDGTINLPVDYLFKLRIFRVHQDLSERLEYEADMYCEENNDYSGDVEAVTERGTFSVTFKKYRSIGGLLK